MSEPKIEPLTKLGNYLLGHQNVIDACWTAKVIEEARQQHTVHLEHVQQFLNEMYATMIDPCEQPEMKVSEMCTLLLKTATEQRQQINDLSEHAPSSPALSLKYFHPPFELREPQSDNEACNIVDSAGNPVAMMYWPTHPVEETLAAEQETYALGRAFAGRVPSSPAAPTPRDKCPQCGSEDRDMPHVGGFQGSLGWVNSDQGYDVCVHSWHNSPAAPTPHMNVVEFAKTGPGRDILTGQQSMFYPGKRLVPLAPWQVAVACRFAEAYAASETARADRLADWKESAMKVLAEINLQEVGKLLKLPLGAAIGKEILPAILKFQADLQRKDAAMRVALEWAANYPLKGFGSEEDGRAARQTYDVIEAALAPISVPAAPEVTRPTTPEEAAQCKDCGRENPVWFAENDVWNAVFPERVGFICPICFIKRADDVIPNTGWKLVPEQLTALSPSPCCANPNLVVKGTCDANDLLHLEDECSSIFNWRPTHNVCLNCGKEEAS